MKKYVKILGILAVGILLHLLAGWPGMVHAVGSQGQAAIRVCIWSGVGLCGVSIFRGGME